MALYRFRFFLLALPALACVFLNFSLTRFPTWMPAPPLHLFVQRRRASLVAGERMGGMLRLLGAYVCGLC